MFKNLYSKPSSVTTTTELQIMIRAITRIDRMYHFKEKVTRCFTESLKERTKDGQRQHKANAQKAISHLRGFKIRSDGEG